MHSRIKPKKYFHGNPKRYDKTQPIRPCSVIVVREDNPGPYKDLPQTGYYSKRDGLNVIWIVYPNSEYGQTINHAHLNWYFTVLSDSAETELHGENRPVFLPL